MKSSMLSRRRMLRGLLNGGAVSVALPFLDCFLDNNGMALAETGTALPVRFGTWFWAMGMNHSIWVPKKTGAGYDLGEELQALSDVKQHVNILSNYRILTDSRPNLDHWSGQIGIRCGAAPSTRDDIPNETLDVSIADRIGDTTRFRALYLAATGRPRDSYSYRSANAQNAPEISAVNFYKTMFGPDFRDPNSPTFTPDKDVMVRKSVLSAVMEGYGSLKNEIGAADRARMDQYFTSIRELEGRLALQLQKPPPAEACIVPKAVDKDLAVSSDWETVTERHRAMTDLLVWAIACNQSKVFNMFAFGADTTKQGVPSTHHITTHEELVDAQLGYQPIASWFTRRSMEGFAYFVSKFASVKEGDGTLLDRTLMFAHSDQSLAKTHSINGVPMMTAGKAGGRLKTGIHVDGRGEASSLVGFTMLQAMGVPTGVWGKDSMRVEQPIPEIFA